MKHITYLVISLFLATSVHAQISLTFQNNALKAGELPVYQEITYVSPGDAGMNQIWDFSNIQFNGKSLDASLTSFTGGEWKGISDVNLILNEQGNEYLFQLTSDYLMESGMVSNEYTTVFSDPILKMKYPLMFGESFTDQFSGTSLYLGTSTVEVSGVYTVTADACGTLILSDRVLKDVLRIRIEKEALAVNMCGSGVSQMVRYAWYAPGYRYPVLNLTTTESRTGDQEPVITHTGYLNLQQAHITEAITGVAGRQVAEDAQDFSVIIFPNPFSEKLSYHYFLRKPVSVSVELYDVSGRTTIQLVKRQAFAEGLHSGELNALDHHLTSGVYYIRFVFDNQVVVSKVIKI